MNDESSFDKLRGIMQEGVLYRKGLSVLMLRCVIRDEAKRILKEVHEGTCGDHTG